jgi:hypothetical protein
MRINSDSRYSSSTSTLTQEKKPKCPQTQNRRVDALAAAIVVAVLVFLGLVAKAEAAPEEFGIESVAASLSTLEAGRHPDVVTEIAYKPSTAPEPQPESISVELPPGLTANPQRVPSCTLINFKSYATKGCPQDAQIGMVEIKYFGSPPSNEPLYNLQAADDEVAHLGFIGVLYPIILEVDLRSESDYGVTVQSLNVADALNAVERIKTTVWGVPADPIHDSQRSTPLEANVCNAFGISDGSPCLAACPFNGALECFENGYFPEAGKTRKSGLAPEPFTTNPASCGPMIFNFKTTSYLLPGQVFSEAALAGEITDCDKVPFDPSLAISNTSHRAGGPTGLEATLKIPQNEAVNTASSSPLRDAKVVLPEGMAINSSAADGLQACSVDQARYQTGEPAQCPDASKLGTLEVVSPSLKRPIKGGIFLRTPEPGHLFRFWLVSNELGVNLKLPAEVELDEQTGQLTTLLHESPQLPAEEVVLNFRGGARAPLRNPRFCGASAASFELRPWSGNPPATGVAPITVDEGCDVGRFDPQLSAGTISPTAGEYSPLVFDLAREDGEQIIAALDLTLPPGLTAKLAGVPLCAERAAASGSCSADSQIGVVRAATGAGSQPLWIPQPGKSPTAVYLGGPYRGAPYSAIAAVPAQAGPFDLGLVTVRSGIYVDPETAQVTVKSDPLPQILQGVPLDYRRVRVEVNRESFTLNPTSCAPRAVKAKVLGSDGSVATPSDRFQAADCANLGFAPKLALHLNGGTKRGDNPRLHAVLTAKPGQANLRRISVAMPHSEFLDQGHIRTVCTRVQFAADACPRGSIYGRARALTPLLDRPLKGLVYLRSSSHELPDLVVDLRGQIQIVLAGRIDSVNGGIRTTFGSTPDAPISKFILDMKGGKRGLLVNSRSLCAVGGRATVKMRAHNGRSKVTRPPLQSNC